MYILHNSFSSEMTWTLWVRNYYILGARAMARWLNIGYFSEEQDWGSGRGPEFDSQEQ